MQPTAPGPNRPATSSVARRVSYISELLCAYCRVMQHIPPGACDHVRHRSLYRRHQIRHGTSGFYGRAVVHRRLSQSIMALAWLHGRPADTPSEGARHESSNTKGTP